MKSFKATTLPADVDSSRSDGLDLLIEIQKESRAAPGMCRTLNLKLSKVSAGEVEFAALPTEDHVNFVGSVHGGYIVTLLDTVMGCACHSLLRTGETYVTVELKTNFLKPVFVSEDKLMATGKVLQKGRSVAFTEGRVVDGAGNLVATATSTCLIRSST